MIFNSHDPRYVPFQEWLERNIIDVDEDSHVLALCNEICCARNKKCFERGDVYVVVINIILRVLIHCIWSH